MTNFFSRNVILDLCLSLFTYENTFFGNYWVISNKKFMYDFRYMYKEMKIHEHNADHDGYLCLCMYEGRFISSQNCFITET